MKSPEHAAFKVILIIAVIIAVAALPVAARAAAHHASPPTFEDFDSDGDGFVSEEEFVTFRAARMKERAEAGHGWSQLYLGAAYHNGANGAPRDVTAPQVTWTPPPAQELEGCMQQRLMVLAAIARAEQEAQVWAGIVRADRDDILRPDAAAQRAFTHRAKMNGKAALGEWEQSLEQAA